MNVRSKLLDPVLEHLVRAYRATKAPNSRLQYQGKGRVSVHERVPETVRERIAGELQGLLIAAVTGGLYACLELLEVLSQWLTVPLLLQLLTFGVAAPGIVVLAVALWAWTADWIDVEGVPEPSEHGAADQQQTHE